MARNTNLASSAIEPTVAPDSLTLRGSKSILNQDHWSEDFQDLSNYCNIGSKMMDNLAQPLGEQLNTPVITVQDEFDFGIRSSAGDDRFETFSENDPWGTQTENRSTTQTELWSSVNNWLVTSNIQQDINDNEEMDIDIDTVNDTNFDLAQEEEFQQMPQHLISSDRDILLSQSSDYPPSSSLVSEFSKDEPDNLGVIDLLKPEPNYFSRSILNEPQQLASVKSICNNNNNKTINMNSVISSCNSDIITSSKSQRREQQSEFVLGLSRGNAKSAFSRTLKKNVPVKEALSSIFKSEEPFIGESLKQLPTCSNINSIITTASSIIAVSNPNITTTCSSGIRNVEFIIPDLVKTEPTDCTDREVETINESTSDIIQSNAEEQLRFPLQTLKKTGLKLDINSAVKLVTSINTPTMTPTTSIAANCNISSTPEVLRPLLQGTGFDLLSYISGDGAGGDDLNSPTVLSVGDCDSPIIDVKKNIAVIRPVQHSRHSEAAFVGKCEPLSEAVLVEKSESSCDVSHLPVVKEEEVGGDEDSCNPCEESLSTIHEDSVLSFSKVSSSRSKRKRTIKKSDDMESDLSNLSDFIEEDDEKHDKTFKLSTPYKRKRTTSNTSRTSSEFSRSTERVSHYGRQRKLSRDTDSSDHDSVASSMDRYRELRDRNNEASRRSRLNRKSREMEMREQADKLEAENRRLKAKADEMEKLVKKLRDGLMKLVLSKR